MNQPSTPWIDFELNHAHHHQVAGVFKLIHAATGQFFIGATSDIYTLLSQYAYLLRYGAHFSEGLQKAYDEDPEFYVDLECTGSAEEMGIARKAAEELKQQWLDVSYGNAKLLNVAPTRRHRDPTLASKAVQIAGRLFSNLVEAAHWFRITVRTALCYVNSPNFPLWTWVGTPEGK